MRKIMFLIGFLIIVAASHAQEKVLIPRDETKKDPSLVTFVARLKKAIASKDEVWLRTVLDKEVVATFGDEAGIESFYSYWSPENDSTDFWPFLSRVVHMGGIFLHDTADESGKYQFVFPYVYGIDLEMEDDYFLIGAITGKNVNLRTGPSIDSTVVTQLSYHVVLFLFEDDEVSSNVGLNEYGEPEWYQVTTYDKSYKGWVNWKYVYSLVGPRLFLFKDKKGAWKISAFVAGD